MSALLEVKNLSTHFHTDDGMVKAVDRVSYDLKEGETLGLVGESGCGKSVSALSLLRLIPNPPGKIIEGEIIFDGNDLLKLTDNEMCDIRGDRISMIFQEPMTSLNPVYTIGKQIAEPMEIHKGLNRAQAMQEAVSLLNKVQIPEAELRTKGYPHQFSGGMRQRSMIAMGLGCNPKLIIADEPTTALDVTIQLQLLELLKGLTRDFGTALVIITHNLGVVAKYADRINVMYAGRIVEKATARDLYADPRHPYTIGLMASVPRLDQDIKQKLLPIEGQPPDFLAVPKGCAFHPRCSYATDRCRKESPELESLGGEHEVACWENIGKPDSASQYASVSTSAAAPVQVAAEGSSKADEPMKPLLDLKALSTYFPIYRGVISRKKLGEVKAVDQINLRINQGETLGLVGESGCGKTTTGRTILHLDQATSGEIIFDGEDITTVGKKKRNMLSRKMQMIFQDPFSCLNPRMTAGQIIGEPLIIHKLVNNSKDYDDQVKELLQIVGLNAGMAERYPHEFSGGQRQRIGIARALSVKPNLIICDEPVSALDVSIQAQIINLLEELQENFNLTYLFIAHDLSVVRHISDRVAVMYLGNIVEIADRLDLYHKPLNPYTQALISAIPIPDPEIEAKRDPILLKGEVPSPFNPPSGCKFHLRCPQAKSPVCQRDVPKLKEIDGSGHWVACHLY